MHAFVNALDSGEIGRGGEELERKWNSPSKAIKEGEQEKDKEQHLVGLGVRSNGSSVSWYTSVLALPFLLFDATSTQFFSVSFPRRRRRGYLTRVRIAIMIKLPARVGERLTKIEMHKMEKVSSRSLLLALQPQFLALFLLRPLAAAEPQLPMHPSRRSTPSRLRRRQ